MANKVTGIMTNYLDDQSSKLTIKISRIELEELNFQQNSNKFGENKTIDAKLSQQNYHNDV